MVMTILVAGCFPDHPDHKTFFFSSFDMYLLSSKAERYRMTNGSCTLVLFVCSQKSCRRFEHSCAVVRGSINDSATDR